MGQTIGAEQGGAAGSRMALVGMSLAMLLSSLGVSSANVALPALA